MNTPKKCIIDNWSLTHTGVLLDDSIDLSEKDNDSLIRNLGGLSNFINAVLLYEDASFIMNNFEHYWKKFKDFDTKINAHIKGIELDELIIDWTNKKAYENHGISNYLFTSRYYGSDLLVAPERSEVNANAIIDNAFIETLRKIDKKIARESKESYSNIKAGIEHNFKIPFLTQYVLSEASNRNDLFTVILQLKTDGKIRKVVREIEEITSTTKGAGKFENDLEYLISKAFGRKPDSNTWSISLSVPFIGISTTIDTNYFRRVNYFVFLKKLIACRTEAARAEKDFQRVFKNKINPFEAPR